MALTTADICEAVAEKVFWEIQEHHQIALDYIQSAIDRVGVNYGIELERIPAGGITAMAKFAAWFISDNNLHRQPGAEAWLTLSDRIAEHIKAKCAWLDAYKKS